MLKSITLCGFTSNPNTPIATPTLPSNKSEESG